MAAKPEEQPLTKYEKARLLGARALQISMGSPYYVKLSKQQLEAIQYDPLEIAKMELKEGKIPLKIRRTSSLSASEEASTK